MKLFIAEKPSLARAIATDIVSEKILTVTSVSMAAKKLSLGVSVTFSKILVLTNTQKNITNGVWKICRLFPLSGS